MENGQAFWTFGLVMHCVVASVVGSAFIVPAGDTHLRLGPCIGDKSLASFNFGMGRWELERFFCPTGTEV